MFPNKFSLALLIAASLTGCANLDNRRNEGMGAAAGAAIEQNQSEAKAERVMVKERVMYQEKKRAWERVHDDDDDDDRRRHRRHQYDD
jgi:hypothetical protein